jgi:uncharacterized protein YecT (DUF1311 family)
MIRRMNLRPLLLPALAAASLSCTACHSKPGDAATSSQASGLTVGSDSGAVQDSAQGVTAPDADASAQVQAYADPDPSASSAAAAPASAPSQAVSSAPVADLGSSLSQDQVEEQYSAAYNTCMKTGDAAKGVTIAMAECVNAEVRRQDQTLNAAYKSAMDKRDEAGRNALRQEERAWIKTRDAKCASMRQGGTIDAVAVPGCLLDETIRRRVRLMPMAG